MYKIDLHTHSMSSPQGGLSAASYRKMLSNGALDYLAVTDHDRIDFAAGLQHEFGERVIVGEEIMTTAGSVIGLFLQKPVRPGLSPMTTIKQIKDQDGLVYIPNPFVTARKGLQPAVLDELVEMIDIIEVANGRTFIGRHSPAALVWTKLNRKVSASSSDAHGLKGLGTCYTAVHETPTRANLIELLASGITICERPNFRSMLYPAYNQMRKKIQKTA